ncbi:MAG: LCP family protein [Alkalibacterium gilvum]|uniref:Transcriptional attenuator, LytR family n=1 Tax=Alkalibacterium gilvum TaxID=1130080 RepID=A0A1H6T2R1_9LACT|nr:MULTISPECIES: LCP family protein [Alkalibacterium]MDN6193900.1 LCP family protein [Alkalibacterium sp.]MDN6293009.1 LCP family protein [Alkalibacterium sp.]MDN6294970.1 LCP family protein [Alkalibacterium sp.]MDN6398335.1 LCP family protein [Alkalibacterium sp.]MDN6728971.1 LCP family protein [Alkalibacterium sp.]
MSKQNKQARSTRIQTINKKKKRTQRIILSILIPLFTVILIGAIYIAKLFATVENEIDASFAEIDRHTPVEKVNPIDEPVSFLFMGVDNNDDRQLGSTRADSIIYATLNPTTHEMNMVSIPRDTYVPIINKGTTLRYDRINSAYAVGEESAMVETVEAWLDLPIHYYATFNFAAFLNIIDELGGIEMDVPVAINEMNSNDQSGSIQLDEGFQLLNGEEALALARTRKIDNDVARGGRQQMIIEAIIKKALNFKSISKYTRIAETVGSNMQTDMRMNDMLAIAQTGLNDSFSISTHIFEWSSFTERGMDLVRINSDSLLSIQNELSDSLNKVENSSNTSATNEDELTTIKDTTEN